MIGIPAALPSGVTHDVAVYVVNGDEAAPMDDVVDGDPCFNIYWALFFLSFVFFPIPLCICGAYGLRSHKMNERVAGRANLIGLALLAFMAAVYVGLSYFDRDVC